MCLVWLHFKFLCLFVCLQCVFVCLIVRGWWSTIGRPLGIYLLCKVLYTLHCLDNIAYPSHPFHLQHDDAISAADVFIFLALDLTSVFLIIVTNSHGLTVDEKIISDLDLLLTVPHPHNPIFSNPFSSLLSNVPHVLHILQCTRYIYCATGQCTVVSGEMDHSGTMLREAASFSVSLYTVHPFSSSSVPHSLPHHHHIVRQSTTQLMGRMSRLTDQNYSLREHS